MRLADDRRQGGYALLLMMLALIGVGGLVASDFSRGVRERAEQERFLDNRRALKEAKRALLMYAYNYPDIAVPAGRRGPGRLPCPDADNDGVPEVLADCSNAGPVPLVGRFPWAANGMNLYDIRDADGQRLWYAVSANFDFADADPINAGTGGTITIHDQNDNLLYDNAVDGVAAVIIAAGPPIERAGVGQDRSIANTDDPDDAVADTDPGIINPTNYLDLFPGRDNADFDNAPGSADGFILGPIYDASGDVIVNDQIILITADEVTRVAQRRALDDYRAAIAAWQETVWANPADRRYPWLNDYDEVVALGNLDFYQAIPGGDGAGRVPVLNYFADHDSHTVIMDLLIDYNLTLNLTDAGPDGGAYVDALSGAVEGPRQLDIRDAYVSVTQREPGGADNRTDDLITLRSDASLGAVATNLVTPPIPLQRLYFWDGCATCDRPPTGTGWALCDLPSTSVEDCAMEETGPWNFEPFTDWADHADIRIRFVELEFSIDAEFEIGLDLSQAFNPDPPANPTPPGAAANARRVYGIAALIPGPGYLDPAIDEDEIPGEDADFIQIRVAKCEQDNFVGNEYNVPELGNANAESYDCAGDVTLEDTPVLTQFDITVDYYPELPVWASQNRWNDTILFAYAPDFAPTGNGDCQLWPPCLTFDHDFDGASTTVFSLLVGANDHPGSVAPAPPPAPPTPGIAGIFEAPNNVPQEEAAGGSPDALYDANPAASDDTLLIVDEL